jgi:hypothetical protein
MRTSRAALSRLLLVFLAACGNEDGRPEQNIQQSEASSGFTVTREDGSTFQLVTFEAVCPPFPEDDPDAGFVHGVASLAGTEIDLTGGKQPKGPLAMVAVRDGLADGTRLELPVVEEYGKEKTGVSFFIADGRNEASSSQATAAGTIEIIHAACEPTPVIELRIDGTLGSEFGDGETLNVDGYGRLE